MNDLVVVPQTNQWQKLKALVLDSVSSPITRRVYNLGLDKFFAWLSVQEPRPGFAKATVSAWRVALERRAGSAPCRSTCGSRRCASWQWRRPITGCWRRSWPTASRA